ncbi:TonB-dependent receptor [Caulobacter sp. KR2-114]|uniref:TonB-dependent receptor n=1 Tax=Caulobacter sp. KR2-114 TaxID=3400912 RepID=UPI003C0E8731
MAAIVALGSTAQAATAAASGSSSSDQPTTLGELVITAERHAENLQDTPIAVSAFSEEKLKTQRLDGGQNLEVSIPNANFSRGNFGGYNFQIRGVGTKVVGSGGTSGVSFNINELPVAANHFADTDFYDVQRVEVLRGPQGTLYGRNATGGAVNVITNQPTEGFGGSITGEYGAYNERKLTGFLNFGLNDEFRVRLAGFWKKTDGFGHNSFTGHHVDGLDLGSIRATVSFKPNDKFSAYLVFEHYQENDTRNRVGKQLCIKDPGPSHIGSYTTNALDREFTTQGCVPGTLYQNAAYGTLNSSGTLGGELTNLIGLSSGDVFATHPLQNHNLHDIESAIDPYYYARSEMVDLHMEYRITDTLTLSSITGFNHNWGASAEDYNRLVPTIPFNTVPDPNNAFASAVGGQGVYTFIYQSLFPGGVINDPQTGASNKLNSFDYGNTEGIEWTQEFRLSSSFSGPLNFSGGLFYSSERNPQGTVNYYVESSSLTAFSMLNNALGGGVLGGPVTVGQGYPPNGVGHNYYDARFGGILQSYAAFGEAYWQATPDIKVTAGLRYTSDKLNNTQYPILLLVPGFSGFPSVNCTTVVSATCNVNQRHTWNALTGRFNVDWTPHLSFTDKTLVYFTYSRGYKGGGFNTPCQGNLGQAGGGACGYALQFSPEFIDAVELGTKNTLMNGALTLNGDFFYYNYKNYQISKIVAESSVNENINAKIYGVEFEGVWSPVRNLTLNANVGYLHTEITGGDSIDTMNLTQSDPTYTLLKTGSGANCIVDTAGLATLLNATSGALGGAGLTKLCSGNATVSAADYNAFLVNVAGFSQGQANAFTGAPGSPGGLLYTYSGRASIDGVGVDLKGKQLPNSPHWTLSFGAQYVFELPGEWKATLRGDYYWQAASYARIYNAVNDQLKPWNNLNATLTFSNADKGIDLQLWVKNLTNNQPLTDTYVTDPTSGMFTNVFTLDPRTYGVSLTKRF